MTDSEDIKSILVLKGPSRYEVLRVAADLTAGGLSQSGFNVTVMDLTAGDFDLSLILKANFDIIFMPQAVLFDIDLSDGTPLVGALPSLCVGWIFDDIIYHYKRVINNRFGNTALLSVDGAADSIAKSSGISSNPILPLLHGGFVASHQWCMLQGETLTYDKPIDVICPCTVGKPPIWQGSDDDVQFKLAQQAISIWKSEPELSPRRALGRVTTDAQFKTVVYVTETIRYLLRKQIIEAVIDAGLNVYLIGEIAEEEHYPDSVTVCGSMNINEVTELIAKSKVLINPFPTLYEEGAHERIFTSIINGAVCFTPGYAFLKNLLGERLEYIDINDLPDAIGRMWEIVGNYQAYLEPILDNAEYALKNHTWEVRGRELGAMLK